MAGRSSQPFEPRNQCRWCDESLYASDIITHKKQYHPRPWKCPSTRCKYHDYGFADEESLQGHVSEKDHGIVSEGCPPSWTRKSTSTTPSDAMSLASPFDKIHLSSPASVELSARSTNKKRAHPRTLTRTWTPEACGVQGQPVPTPSVSPLTPLINSTVTQEVSFSTFAGSEEFEWEGSSSLPMDIPMAVQEEEMRDLPTGTRTDSDSPLSSLASTPSPPPQNTASASFSSLSSLSSFPFSFTLGPIHPSLLPKSPPTSLIFAILPFLMSPSPEHIPTPSAYALPPPKALPMGCKACLHAPTPNPTPTKPKEESDLPFRNLCPSEENKNGEGECFPRTCIHLSCAACHHPLPGALALESSHPQPCIFEIPRPGVGLHLVSDAELTDAPGDPDIPALYAAVLAQHCGSDFFGSAHETQPPIPETVWESLFVCLAEERLVLEGSSARLASFRELVGGAGLRARREEVRTWRTRYCVFAEGWGKGIEGDTTGELVYRDDVLGEDSKGGIGRRVVRGGKRKRGKEVRKERAQVKRRGTRRTAN